MEIFVLLLKSHHCTKHNNWNLIIMQKIITKTPKYITECANINAANAHIDIEISVYSWNHNQVQHKQIIKVD